MPAMKGLSKARRGLLVSLAAMMPMAFLADCAGTSLHDAADKFGDLTPSSWPSLSDPDDAHIRKLTPDSTVPIMLISNKQRTTFAVNGVELPEAKTLQVKVPQAAIRITARAPCYQMLEQRAGVDGFGAMSQFEFTFADWDRRSTGRNCS